MKRYKIFNKLKYYPSIRSIFLDLTPYIFSSIFVKIEPYSNIVIKINELKRTYNKIYTKIIRDQRYGYMEERKSLKLIYIKGVMLAIGDSPEYVYILRWQLSKYEKLKKYLATVKLNKLDVVIDGGKYNKEYIRPQSITFDDIILNTEKKNKIIKVLSNFKNNKEWYTKNKIPYNLIMLFYGDPGTGKTSIANAVASMLEMPVVIPPYDISTFRSNRIYLYEDCDLLRGFKKRTSLGDEVNDDKSSSDNTLLSKMLNVLCGFRSEENVVVIMTTNCIDKLDPAVLRRASLCMNIDALTNVEILEFYNKCYPQDTLTYIDSKPIAGYRLKNWFEENPMDSNGFLKELNNYNNEINTEC